MRLMFIAFSLAVVLVEGTHACFCGDGVGFRFRKPEYHNFYCHNWTQEDHDAMGPNPSVEAETKQCESYLGNKFTHGNNTKFPKCGTCLCCKPEVYRCYKWQAEDLDVLGSNPTTQQKESQCESHEHFVFQGSSKTYRYCGDCGCCQPVYKCHFWTTEDNEIMGQSPTWEIEKARCEDDLHFIFTHGNNEYFPGTGECRCIKPVTDE